MITRFEASNFRMMAGNRIDLKSFHVLVGPNGAGKTTFLDAFQFVSDIIRIGLKEAVKNRASSLLELCYDVTKPIGFGLEISLPLQEKCVRYEMEIVGEKKNGLRISRENLFIVPLNNEHVCMPSLFGPSWHEPVIHDRALDGWRKVAAKTSEGNDWFGAENDKWRNSFKFGLDKAALGSLPEDPARFPVAISVRDFLRDGIRTLALDARKMRSPSGPDSPVAMALDGSNLPHVIQDFKNRDPVLFEEWVNHLKTTIVGLKTINVRERPEDKFLVLQALFVGLHGESVPSWLLSDGTLRFMALTLASYSTASDAHALYLIEEPENGLYPFAIEAVHKTLSSPPGDTQCFCATHSPIFLANVRLEDVLVFRRSVSGCSDMFHGGEVEALKNWKSGVNVASLLASGVLS